MISTKETLEDLKELRDGLTCEALVFISGERVPHPDSAQVAWKCAFLAKRHYVLSRFAHNKDAENHRFKAFVWYHLAFMADEYYKPQEEIIEKALDLLMPLTGGEGFTIDEKARARDMFARPGKVKSHVRNRHVRDAQIEEFPFLDEFYKPLPWDRDMTRVKSRLRGCKSEEELLGRLAEEGIPLIGAFTSESGSRYVVFRASGREIALKNLEFFMMRK